jgi:choline dehydrogenase-like flavoprotein
MESHFNVAIIGGGPAGLAAAQVLGRQRRQVVLIDNAEAVLHKGDLECELNVPFGKGEDRAEGITLLEDGGSVLVDVRLTGWRTQDWRPRHPRRRFRPQGLRNRAAQISVPLNTGLCNPHHPLNRAKGRRGDGQHYVDRDQPPDLALWRSDFARAAG